jgi:glycosyltransferase involved in cell wall biosynthesis
MFRLVTPPDRPLVTAVVAAHDAARHIESALASLSSQTLRDLEVVVVDDGSKDGTARVVEDVARSDARIRLVRLDRNRGQSAALNVGMASARGRYLAILDADDEATPERLAEQVAAFERDPDLVLVGGAISTWCDRHAAPGQVWRYATDDAAIRVRTLFKSEVISGAVTIDRERVVRHQLRFDETLRLGADWAMSIAAMRVGRVGNVGSVVMRYRIHPGQMTTGMMDDLGSDSTRIRRGVLAWAGLQPTDAEMRTHLAISPCNYWPFGSHPYFRASRDSIGEEAERWLERLTQATARAGRVPPGAMRAYVDEILSMTARALEEPEREGELASPCCPVSAPLACVAAGPCR